MDSSLDFVLTAVYRNNLAALQQTSAFELNMLDEDGRTPLMHAVLAEYEHLDIIQFLTENSENIDRVDTAHGWAALHFAARGQKLGSVRLLLGAGASVDVETVEGNTPLFLSLTGAPPDRIMIQELLLHGAQPNHRNHGGVSPLSLAHTRQWSEIESLLSNKNPNAALTGHGS